MRKEDIIYFFERQVLRTPNNIAIAHENEEVTYFNLNQKINHISYFLRKKGVKKSDIVCVFMDKSIDLASSIVAIMKVGGVFLLVNKKTPKARLKKIIKQTKCKIILTKNKYKEGLSEYNGKVFIVDKLIQKKTNNRRIKYETKSTDTAAIVYTSGTSGEPKGVMLTHKGIINNVKNKIKLAKISDRDIISLNLSVEFIGFVWQLFVSLLSGAKAVIYGSEKTNNPLSFFSLIHRDRVSILGLTPSYLSLYLSVYKKNKNEKFLYFCRLIFLVGEKARITLVKEYFKNFSIPIFYIYGSTENSGMTTYNILNKFSHKILDEGRAIKNTQLFVLNTKNKVAKEGQNGDLFVSGSGLMKGYIDDYRNNENIFLSHPQLKHEIILKTGDRAKMLRGGRIQILGRSDFLLNIKGLKIDPEEICKNLLNIRLINNVHVMKVKKYHEAYIVAYYTTRDNLQINSMIILKHLKKNLPEKYIPRKFVHLNKMPLKNNGKINYMALKKINISNNKKIKKKQNNIESELLNIWKSVLSVRQVNPLDNWFKLGADSLKIFMVYEKIIKKMGRIIKLSDLFRHTNIHDLTLFINERQKR